MLDVPKVFFHRNFLPLWAQYTVILLSCLVPTTLEEYCIKPEPRPETKGEEEENFDWNPFDDDEDDGIED